MDHWRLPIRPATRGAVDLHRDPGHGTRSSCSRTSGAPMRRSRERNDVAIGRLCRNALGFVKWTMVCLVLVQAPGVAVAGGPKRVTFTVSGADWIAVHGVWAQPDPMVLHEVTGKTHAIQGCREIHPGTTAMNAADYKECYRLIIVDIERLGGKITAFEAFVTTSEDVPGYNLSLVEFGNPTVDAAALQMLRQGRAKGLVGRYRYP